ncbi:MAG TPA: TIR domain-containing protein [Rhodanobacter sp.]|jgi:tetratricopeptide (TPR) repeat protein
MTPASVMPAFRYRAFISYSHQDKAWANWLHGALETYAIPKRLVGRTTAAGVIPPRLAPIFRDRDELASATDLGRMVNEALAQSANLIVICSPRSAASPWVNAEVLAFKRMGYTDRIFCLIVDGEPNTDGLPGREAEECLAPALRFRLDKDGQPTTERTEPIAADARAGKDGKVNAKLKLIAGMLDVGFDMLKQRELQRRNRRMARITALALVVMVITSVLAVTAFRAQRLAEHERSQAEGLINFMLGDLNTKLQAVNHLDIIDDVADKAMDYFSSLDESEVTNDSLMQHAKALQLIGSVREEQGKLPEARRAFEASQQLMQPLVARYPHNAEWRIALADSHSWLGMVAWDHADLPQALAQFRMAAPLVEGVVREHPEKLDWLKHLGWLHNNIGHVLEARGQLSEAQQEYGTVLEIYRKLVELAPANRRYRVELGHAYDNLAGISHSLGDLAAAQGAASQELAIWQALAQQDADDLSVQVYLARANAMLAKIMQARGEGAASVAALEDSLAISDRLSAADPTSTDVMSDLASYSRGLAHGLRMNGDAARAGQLLRNALTIYARLVAKVPDEPAWQTNLAESDLESSRLAWKKGDVAAARTSAETAHALIAAVMQQHADYSRAPPLLAEIDIVQGQLQMAGGDLPDASTHWEAALKTIEQMNGAPAGSTFAFLVPHAEALCLLGRTGEASPVVATLQKLGYRDAQYLQSIDITPCRSLHQSRDIAVSAEAATH